MGLYFLGSNSSGNTYPHPDSCQCNYCVLQSTPSNPNPKNWTILRHLVFGKFLVIELRYPGCTNFEGKKILVFNCSLQQLKEQKLIDPHFSNHQDKFYPIARFQPTFDGWSDACTYTRAKAEQSGHS